MLNRKLMCNRLNKFLDYLSEVKGKSEKTIDSYASDLHMFLAYHQEKKKHKEVDLKTQLTKINISKITDETISKITLDDMYSFISYLKDKGNAASSRNRRVMSIKSFYKYLYKKAKIVKENIAEELETAEVPQKEQAYLKSDEMNKVLNTVKQEDLRHTERNNAIMVTLMNTGIRNSELRMIKLQDIDWENKIIKIMAGKGNKFRKVPMNDSVINAIKEWLVFRDDINTKDGYEDYLFLSQQGTTISKDMLNKIVKDYINKADFDATQLHTHSLRHSSLTALLKNTNNNYKLVQKISGHKSVSTLINIYTHVEDEEIQEAVSNLNIG